jgi:hypothetical protein
MVTSATVAGVAAQDNTWIRFSLLKRSGALTPQQFRTHYENVHGPLAASQAGFRKFTSRYVQNHVEDRPDGADPAFDGVTATTQVPRPDYTIGFFHEPDYAAVKPDELYLFDMARTVSVLGEVIETTGAARGAKAIVLAGEDWRPGGPPAAGAPSTRVSRLERAKASALGFGGAVFAHSFLVECWFADPARRAALVADPAATFGTGAVALAVRELLVFGPEKPWAPALRPGGIPAA